MNLVALGLYLGVGFLVASALFRFYPPDRVATDNSDVFLFVVAVVVWPIAAAVFFAIVPFKLLFKYVNYLKSFTVVKYSR